MNALNTDDGLDVTFYRIFMKVERLACCCESWAGRKWAWCFFRSMWFDVVKPQQSDFNALLYRMSQTKKRKIKLCFGTCCHVGSDNEVFRMAAIFAWALICVQCKFETLKKEQISNFWNVPKTQKTQQASFESCCMMWEEILPSAGQGMVCLWIWFGTICWQSDRGGYALSFSCIRWLCVVMEWACHCHSLRWISGNSVVMVDFLRQRQGNSMSLPARALGLQEGYSQERCFRCFFFMFSELLLNGWQFLEVATKRCCSLRCLLPSLLLKKKLHLLLCKTYKTQEQWGPWTSFGLPGALSSRVHEFHGPWIHGELLIESRLVQQAIAELRWEDGGDFGRKRGRKITDRHIVTSCHITILMET